MKRGVKREILYIVSGLMWTGVGVMLNILSINWFNHSKGNLRYFALIGGVLSGIIIAILGFGILAKKNIKRIYELSNYTCIFNFQEIRSYFIIIFMIALGIFMRKSGFFSKEILSFVYSAIGTGLFLASFLYYKEFLVHLREIDN